MANHAGFSPLTAVETAFRRLSEMSPPIALDIRSLSPDLPDRFVGLGELSALVMDREAASSLKDLLWSEIVRATQSVVQPWTLVAAGLMVRSLRTAAYAVLNRHGGERADIEGDVLVGFVEALRVVDPSMRGITFHLKQVAYQRAIGASVLPDARFNHTGVRAVPLVTRPGHPDLVLARAVDSGVLTMVDAELVGRTRLEDSRLSTVARELGLPLADCLERRDWAETQLADYLHHTTE